jgi:beta-galactosidase
MTYQLTSEQFAVNQVQHWIKKCAADNHAGGANWIFSDSTSGGRVPAEVARASGEVDGVRLPKEAYYVCQVMFRDTPGVHIIGHWSYPADRETTKAVYVASNGDEVELLVNGKSLGKTGSKDRYLFEFPNVKVEPGEIKAIAYANGKPIAEQSKKTAGKPVALRMTSITGPGGLCANGGDVALIDVEAIDEAGQRCPTFEQRVDFETTGPAIWRGGYNSGKIRSINNPYLNLECGINRVSIRSTREAGTIKVTAKCEGLKPATIEIASHPAAIENGIAKQPPAMPVVALPSQRPTHGAEGGASPLMKGDPQTGRFITGFNYTGPTSGASVQRDALDGKKVYADADTKFESLPTVLKGADWLQLPNADNRYSAEDLIELQVKTGSRVFIAHDARLSPPPWISANFKPSDGQLLVNGQPMRLFERKIGGDESLTLSSNTEDAKASCNMYVVFVNGGPSAK